MTMKIDILHKMMLTRAKRLEVMTIRKDTLHKMKVTTP